VFAAVTVLPWVSQASAVAAFQRSREPGLAADGVLDAYLEETRRFQASASPAVSESFLARGVDWYDAASSALCSAALRSDGRAQPPVVEAAIVLHLSAALVADLAAVTQEYHLRRAAWMVEQVRDVLPRDFQRRVAVAAVWFWQGRSELELATIALDAGLGRFGRDPDLMLAQATLWETLAPLKKDERPSSTAGNALGRIMTPAPSGRGQYKPTPGWSTTREIYQQCAGLLSTTIQLAPGLDEARVRLAHVQILLERYADAVTAVERVAAAGRTPTLFADDPVPYWAALMYGRALIGAGDVDRALASMRRAQSICPDCQTARIGVSQALRAAGDGAAADDIVLSVLRDRWEGRQRSDPWWDYPGGQRWRLAALVERLFREVRG
jgi:hypothetical protein